MNIKIPDISLDKYRVFGNSIIRLQSRQNFRKSILDSQLTGNFALKIRSFCHLSEYWVGTRLNEIMIIKKILYFHPLVGFTSFYLSYNRKKALNILIASVMLFLTRKNLNFLTLITYNLCFSRGSFGQLFCVFQDYDITLRTRVFINLAKKIE